MITCYIISVVILAQTIAALSSPISVPTELADFSLASPWLQHGLQRLQSSPTSASSSGAASSSDAAVYTTVERRILIHEEKLWLELDELADEAISKVSQMSTLLNDNACFSCVGTRVCTVTYLQYL